MIDVPECRAVLTAARVSSEVYPDEVRAAELSAMDVMEALGDSAVAHAAVARVLDEVFRPAASAMQRDTRAALAAVGAAVEEYAEADRRMASRATAAMQEGPQ